MADKYSASPGMAGGESAFSEGSVGLNQLEELIAALFETQPMQFLMSLMRQAGISGNTDPAVPPTIPPDESAMPLGQGQPQLGQDQPNSLGAPAQGSPGGAPTDGTNPAAPAPPSLAQTPPNMGQGPNPMTNPSSPSAPAPSAQKPAGFQIPPKKDNYSRTIEDLAEENDKLRETLQQAIDQLNGVTREKVQQERYSRLVELAKSYKLDPKKELQRVDHYSEAGFDAHLEIIRDNYQRTITAIPDFAAVSAGSVAVMEPNRSSKDLTPEQVAQVEKYSMEHDVGYWEAKDKLFGRIVGNE